MTRSLIIALAALTAGQIALVSGAEARGGAKEYFVQDYKFNKPMNGYSGHSGNYYCDFVKVPDRTCDASGRCKVTGWTLRQTCY